MSCTHIIVITHILQAGMQMSLHEENEEIKNEKAMRHAERHEWTAKRHAESHEQTIKLNSGSHEQMACRQP